ncbi:DUF2780 domain-containing protein [Aliiglaciecola sp. 3_MG-2023]|uniref:DUF2780 domain-containing protein n=1 Tax=Aliiglaciecola sp. 3_MG-2023 TaxID=3062644 RepID=UPI0026E26551|nr:DUF2780 domain-containing protein [Aliiglaciecola sp. 3_MG-2023]MDO6694211.1 DUF2780 domain-containing protein [Aliiglaciecola sp. 3_MG-2023]
MKILSALLISTFVFSGNVLAADDTLNKLQGLLGSSSSSSQVTDAQGTDTNEDTQSFDIASLVTMVSENLDVSEAQSEGGLASIFDYAKDNLSDTNYTELAQTIPGLDSLLDNVPALTSDASTDSASVSGLLSKASEYSSSLSTINELKQQFDALGLDTEMITSFISQINSFFSEDKDTLSLLQSGLGNLATAL